MNYRIETCFYSGTPDAPRKRREIPLVFDAISDLLEMCLALGIARHLSDESLIALGNPKLILDVMHGALGIVI